MSDLTPEGDRAVQNLAMRYGVSYGAVKTLLFAVNSGGGTMAQFSHPELGGSGQWMRGGMTMVGDMFNSGLQSTVAGICSELSDLLSSTLVIAPPPPRPGGSTGGSLPGNRWWPDELGVPSSSGGQNDMQYAVFPQARRLAILQHGKLTVYDTLNHQIGGVQQQSGGGVSFGSQFGTVFPNDLPVVTPSDAGGPGPEPMLVPPPMNPPPMNPPPMAPTPPEPIAANDDPALPRGDIFEAIERLGTLHRQGVLSDSEFAQKKAELLSRI